MGAALSKISESVANINESDQSITDLDGSASRLKRNKKVFQRRLSPKNQTKLEREESAEKVKQPAVKNTLDIGKVTGRDPDAIMRGVPIPPDS